LAVFNVINTPAALRVSVLFFEGGRGVRWGGESDSVGNVFFHRLARGGILGKEEKEGRGAR